LPEITLMIERDPDEAEAAEVCVDGAVGGRPYRFLLDTGAAVSGVAHDAYTAGFASVGTNSSSGVFAPISDALIAVPSLSIGPVTWHNVTLARTSPGPGAKNLIGMDLLKDFCCHFFFDDARLVMTGDAAPENRYAFEPLVMDQRFHPYIDVVFGGVQASTVWDTGASLSVVDTGFVARQPAFFEAAGVSMGTDAAGAQVETPMFVMSGAVVGGKAFPAHRVAAVDLSHLNAVVEVPMDLILGYSTLSKANWIFDFPHRQWALSKWPGR
jgi:hypothetical protein